MKFTIVFDSKENCDLSYGLVFIPNATWIKGEEVVIDLPPSPYKSFEIKKLLKKENISKKINSKNCFLICYTSGNGNDSCITILEEELKMQKFTIEKIYFEYEFQTKQEFIPETTLWEKIIHLAKQKSIATAALLSNGDFESIDYENKVLTVSFKNPQFIEIMKKSKYANLEEVLFKLFGSPFKLEMINSKE